MFVCLSFLEVILIRTVSNEKKIRPRSTYIPFFVLKENDFSDQIWSYSGVRGVLMMFCFPPFKTLF